jgi:hypothetical protein
MAPQKAKGPRPTRTERKALLPYCGVEHAQLQLRSPRLLSLAAGIPANARPARISVNVALDAWRPTLSGRRRPGHPAGLRPGSAQLAERSGLRSPSWARNLGPRRGRRQISPVDHRAPVSFRTWSTPRRRDRGSRRRQAVAPHLWLLHAAAAPAEPIVGEKMRTSGGETVPRAPVDGAIDLHDDESVQVVTSKPRHIPLAATPDSSVSLAHNCSLLSTQPMQRATFCRPKTWRSSPYMLATQSDKTTTS